MQIEDVLKLYLQGILGPAHNVSSFEKCLERTLNEYRSITNNQYLNIEENISSEYVRIYLYPYYQKMNSFDLLVKYFILSSQDKVDINAFIPEVKKLINKENEEYINQYLAAKNYLISHSQIYKDNYDPHYLVINRKYIKNIY
ncbi:MAG: hypothetical protein J6X50_03240 [Bacilli bacterium]|nr:hypothetical protein [Bacilli bacterium]